VVNLIESAGKRDSGESSRAIPKAFALAEEEFGRLGKQGQKNLEHSVRVAKTLFDLGFDNTTIAAGLVHDIEAKAGTPKEKVALKLGGEIEKIVTECAKIRQIEAKNLGTIGFETLSTVILATAGDIRAIFIKFATRLDTLQGNTGLSKKKLAERAAGALEIYAPLCQKLGLYEMEGLLEDYSLKINQPKTYNSISKLLGKSKAERKAELGKAIEEFSALVSKEKGNVSVQGRVKGIYSIQRKMETQGKSFDEICDLLGVRMVCDSIRECYELLGIVHSEYKIVPNRFADYIANPKKNGYRSIHTAIFWNGKPLEVQIRTREMHYENETGLASHWQYKRYASDRFFDKRLSWAKQLVEWHRSAQGTKNLAHSLRMGFGKNMIFVFTPKHQVVVLPEGATPIDFAFAIHSDLGHKCLKAKVNDKIVTLNHGLDNADKIEIITAKQPQTKRQWLSITKSRKAQGKIRQKLGIKVPKKKLLPEKGDQPIASDKNTRIAKCCNPVPGDEIVGVRTTKRKVSVHRAHCANTVRVPRDRKVEIKWGLAEKDYVVGIKVKAKDNPGLLPAILNIIGKNNVAISATDAKTTKNNILQCKFDVRIKNSRQLDEIIGKIALLPGVFEAIRE